MRFGEPDLRLAAAARERRALHLLVGAAGVLLASAVGVAAQVPFIPNNIVTSTVPKNGDLNPYGVALVPADFPPGGTIARFDILVSNFNNSKNLQGTGTTIIKYTPNPGKAIAPPGAASVFFQSADPKVTGLDTGLNVLRRGFVLCAFLPSADGSFMTHTAGGILVVDKKGRPVSTIAASKTNLLNSPWDMTIFDQGATALAFVSNVGAANNHGFVVRLNLSVSRSAVTVNSATMIASGYMARPNAAGFVTGPTGLVFDPVTHILYVASTKDNAVFAVQHADTRNSSGGPGIMIFNDMDVLHGPLGMAQAPNGDLIVANSDLFNPVNGDPTHPSEYVEFTKNGTKPGNFVDQFNIDVLTGGAFGIAVGTAGPDNAPRLVVVDDAQNNINIFTGLPPAINAASR
jgi:hypothetical protein